ncbi:MAG: ATPase, partial [Thermodesulfobacteriota bacterium]
DVWQVRFADRTVHVKHSRGIADLALLLATRGESIHVADLMNGVGTPRERPGADPVLDDRALADYRERLAALEAALGTAEAACDAERSAALDEERAALLKELRAATGKGGRRRTLHAADERARKAVSSRLRDGVARLRDAHPDLGRHLDESLVTGTWCSYSPRRPIRWST